MLNQAKFLAKVPKIVISSSNNKRNYSKVSTYT